MTNNKLRLFFQIFRHTFTLHCVHIILRMLVATNQLSVTSRTNNCFVRTKKLLYVQKSFCAYNKKTFCTYKKFLQIPTYKLQIVLPESHIHELCPCVCLDPRSCEIENKLLWRAMTNHF